MNVHVFVGPTISHAAVMDTYPNVVIHPPIRHGDLLASGLRRGDVALIVDGLWHRTAPIRHKEILHSMEAGIRVIGAGSMGALRAAELDVYGMVGVGSVYAAFKTKELVADDEVAVLHSPDGYDPLTEALVNVRWTLRAAVASGTLTSRRAESFLAIFRRQPVQYRTWSHVEALLPESTELAEFVAWRKQNSVDIKRRDAEAGLRLAYSTSSQDDGQPAIAARWRTGFIRDWQARFAPSKWNLPVLALMQYSQLYDPQYPQLWRRHVLSWIVADEGCSGAHQVDNAAIEDVALAGARRRGIILDDLSDAQLAYWLTPTERRLPAREQLCRLLVRSARVDACIEGVWPCTSDEALHLIRSPHLTANAVAEAFEINDRVASTRPGRTISHLRTEVIIDHLSSIWNVPADSAILKAAARDRGFSDLDGAIGVARAFFLAESRRDSRPRQARARPQPPP